MGTCIERKELRKHETEMKVFPSYVVHNNNGSDGKNTTVLVCADIIKQRETTRRGRRIEKDVKCLLEINPKCTS